MQHLYEAVDAAGDEHLAVGRETRDLWVALLAELEAALELRREALHLVARPGRLPAEQVERRARRQQPLPLLPARGARAPQATPEQPPRPGPSPARRKPGEPTCMLMSSPMGSSSCTSCRFKWQSPYGLW